jgi:hypothetical protein
MHHYDAQRMLASAATSVYALLGGGVAPVPCEVGASRLIRLRQREAHDDLAVPVDVTGRHEPA